MSKPQLKCLLCKKPPKLSRFDVRSHDKLVGYVCGHHTLRQLVFGGLTMTLEPYKAP